MTFSAESIALSLDKGRRIRNDHYTACCPAHDDRNPSLSITQASDNVLLYCHSGCSQSEVIDELIRRGLWPEKRKRAKINTLVDREEMQSFCAAHEYNLRKSIPTCMKAQGLYRQYQRVLCTPFTPGEIIEMHLYCLLYRADIRKGKPTAPEDDNKFLAFQRVVYEKGVPYEA